MLFSAVTQQVIGILLAVFLTNIPKGRNVFKNIYYLPSVLSSAALGLLWAFMFNPKIGINQLLAQFGIKGPLWLMDSKGFIVLPMWVIAFVALWQYVGQNMMLYMAQITGISKDIYEASYVDGASKPAAFRYITLPLIKPDDGHLPVTELYRFIEILRFGLQHDTGRTEPSYRGACDGSCTRRASITSNTAMRVRYPLCCL